MFILKNAWRSITRNRGRSILTVLIVAVISLAATIGLSIRNAASEAETAGLENVSVTAQISVDRDKLMEEAQESMDDSADDSTRRDAMRDALETDALTLDDYKSYADASSVVKTTYYTEQSYLGATDAFQPVESTSEHGDDSSADSNGNSDSGDGGQGGFGGPDEQQESSASYATDFTVIGFSSDEALKNANDGNYELESGQMFSSDSTDEVVISSALASFNDVSVGDTISVESPDGESTHDLTVVGIYKNTSESSSQMGPGGGGGPGGMSSSSDNALYVSTGTLEALGLDSVSMADADGQTEPSTRISYTYVFNSKEDYEQFVSDVESAGLPDEYTVSSEDVSEYEQSLVPIQNLSKFAVTLLLIVLGVGAIVLIAINLFSVRERKYEIGVMTAIGVKKWKVAVQFIVEILIITMIGMGIGAIVGAASSVPVADQLLASQVEAMESSSSSTEKQFGRETEESVTPPSMSAGGNSNGQGGMPGGFGGSESSTDYISDISATVNPTVIAQLLGIGLALSLIAGMVGVVFVMRYEPLQILAERS